MYENETDKRFVAEVWEFVIGAPTFTISQEADPKPPNILGDIITTNAKIIIPKLHNHKTHNILTLKTLI